MVRETAVGKGLAAVVLQHRVLLKSGACAAALSGHIEGAHLAETITVDLCVIGGGLAGLTAAAEARRLGASVVLVERHRLGGGYLHTGTVPARALAAAAAHAQAMRAAGPFGITAETPRVNARKVHDGIQEVVASLAPAAAISHLESLGIRVLAAEARFIDARTLSAGEDRVQARHFIIATGARSVTPAVPGLEGVPFFTSETIFDNTRRLTHLLIIGAGAAGLELAQAYNRLGTQVTVVDAGRPFPGLDAELAEVVLERLREEGVEIRAETAVTAIQPRSQGIGIVLRTGDEEERLDVSHIFVADDRVPDVELLDLDSAGIRRSSTDGRFLDLSRQSRTSNRRVFAIGDAAGTGERPHLAAWQATAVVRHLLLLAPVRLDPAAAPTVYFTDPEVATVGLSETTARTAHGIGFEVLRASFADNDRACATRQVYGLVKLVAGRDGTILGAAIVGDRAGELIATIGLAMSQRLKVSDLGAFIAPHPSLAETLVALGREYQRARGVDPLTQGILALRRYLP